MAEEILAGADGQVINVLEGDGPGILVSSITGDDAPIGGANASNLLFGDANTPFQNTGGNDTTVAIDDMWGDAATMISQSTGALDTFVFALNDGNDVTHDFRQGDVIDFDGFADLPAASALPKLPMTFADMNIEAIDANSDGIRDSSVIHLDSQNSVTVLEVTGLMASDFLFIA